MRRIAILEPTGLAQDIKVKGVKISVIPSGSELFMVMDHDRVRFALYVIGDLWVPNQLRTVGGIRKRHPNARMLALVQEGDIESLAIWKSNGVHTCSREPWQIILKINFILSKIYF